MRRRVLAAVIDVLVYVRENGPARSASWLKATGMIG